MKKKCPYCGEEIMAIAKKCRFCGEWLEDTSSNDSDSLIKSHQISSTPLNKSTVYYPSSLLNCLLIVGMIGAVMQLLIYLTPKWVVESICDYSYENLIAYVGISCIVLYGIELVFILMTRNKILQEKWNTNLPLWLLIYAIALGIIVLSSFIGMFTLDIEDFSDDTLDVIPFLITLVPCVVVGFKYLDNDSTLSVGLATLAVLAVDIITTFFLDDPFKIPSNGSVARFLLLIIVGVPLYLFDSYRKFLQEK